MANKYWGGTAHGRSQIHDKSLTRYTAVDKLIFTLIGVVIFIVYILTLAPDLTWSNWGADGGDFIVAVVRGTLPHPPGFPLYLMIGRLLMFVPVGTVPWRMNLLSAIMASGTVLLTALTLREKGLSIWSTAAASLALGFAPLFWSQALITEVYTSAAFFVSLTYYFTTIVQKYNRSAIMPGIAWGMAVAIHPTTAITALYFWMGRKKIWGGIIAGMATVILCYAIMFFCGTEPQRWADTSSIEGWFAYGSGRLYWDYAFGMPADQLPRRAVSWLTLLVRQFTPFGALLVIVGIYKQWHLSKNTTVGLVLCAGIITLYSITYNSFDSFIYLVPILPLFTEVLGRGMDWLSQNHIPSLAMLMIPIILVFTNWQTVSLHTDYRVAVWLESTLRQIPEGGIALTDEDAHTFALWYAQDAAGRRKDIVVLDTRLWEFQPYRRYLSNVLDSIPLDFRALGTTYVLCEVNNKGVECQ